ncbi:glycosyltransferase [Algoriphagus sp. AGSA1]|uniref:glycosyltransferase n=1 Tax=Algoriphagus sp. AGSA1 TaxID=2907213 RepID=UPI001F2B749E|nr:glycosyltransferase [Algoriphagus sp. AGSA1]MCE7055293.1 glycosyltransferase [Algoriphagus sp. AGSA1]
MKFSCLMSCYFKDDPEELKTCFESLIHQKRKADELILVKDGPLTEELDLVIESYKDELAIEAIQLPDNKGLGFALNLGVKSCKYELIARIDADDICIPQRFEKQISLFESHPKLDVVGSWISEFESDPLEIYAYRELPVQHEEILEYAKRRNPMNHMTVVFRKSAVLDSGNYDPVFKFAQDYILWANMLMKGYIFQNIPEYLVNARAGIKMLERRGGSGYFGYEIKLQKQFLKLGLINRYEMLSNLLVRGFVRLIPNKLRGVIYQNILRKK